MIDAQIELGYWQCFGCNYTNKTLTKYDYSRQETRGGHLITLFRSRCVQCGEYVNPLFFTKYNKSKKFSITKPFGIRLHWRRGLKTIGEVKQLYHYNLQLAINSIHNGNNMNNDKYLRIIICFGEKYIYEYICHNKYQTTFGDIKQISCEIANFYENEETSKYFEWNETSAMFRIDEQPQMQLFNFDDKIIDAIDDKQLYLNMHLPYLLIYHTNFGVRFKCKKKYQVTFKNKWIPCQNINKYKQCPLSIMGNAKTKQDIKHLSYYNHFESFNKKHPICQFGDQCIYYQTILQLNNVKIANDNEYKWDVSNNEYFKIQSQQHLFLFHHPPRKSHSHMDVSGGNSLNNYNSENIFSGNNIVCFEMLDEEDWENSKIHPPPQMAAASDEQLVYLLTKETIKNGFEKDLLPINQSENGRGKNNGSIGKYYDGIIHVLKQQYGIFDIINEKMEHPYAKNRLKNTLEMHQILALVLYCNGECNYSLSKMQREMKHNDMWPFFHYCLNIAIHQISKFEHHAENLYTGIAGAYLDVANTMKRDENGSYCQSIKLKSNVSFSTDLNVAKEFCGSQGMIIGLNIQRSIYHCLSKIDCCDVSVWISKFPHEKEVLMLYGTQLLVRRDKIRETKSNTGDIIQWIVCDEGDEVETSFQNMFLVPP